MMVVPGTWAEPLEAQGCHRQKGGKLQEGSVCRAEISLVLGMLKLEKSVGQASGDAESTAGHMCPEVGLHSARD